MSNRYFIEETSLVEEMMDDLTPTGEISGYQRELYLDVRTGEKWEKYLLEDEETGDDIIALRRFPYPDTDTIINIALTSSYPDEVAGAALLLYDIESDDKIEFREQLIEAMEKNINNIDVLRYEAICDRASLYDATNRRKILGKHHSEIMKDAQHFLQMKQRAEQLKLKITAANN